MFDMRDQRRRDPFEEPGEIYQTGTKPGAVTLTQHLPVQRKAKADAGPVAPMETYGFIQAYGGEVQAKGSALFPDDKPTPWMAAEQGTSGSAGRLPHLDTIQPLFGKHDVSSVRAYTDNQAAAGASAMGAEAFAVGDQVAFGGAPSLHTAAHEAAHVVQQRAGVALKGGVGQAGDRYEHHADAVADKVVRGESAESLLDQMAGSGGGGGKAVQKQGGEFDDIEISSDGPFALSKVRLWLLGKGERQSKQGLVEFFSRLESKHQMRALEIQLGTVPADMADFKKAMKPMGRGASLDWDAFSDAIRQARADEDQQAHADTQWTKSGKLEKAGTGLAVAKGANTGTEKGTEALTTSPPGIGGAPLVSPQAPGVSGVLGVTGVVGPALGIVGSSMEVAQVGNARHETRGKATETVVKSASATADIGRSAALTGKAAMELGAAGSEVAAQAAATWLGIVAGAGLLVSGTIGAFTHYQGASRLGAIEEESRRVVGDLERQLVKFEAEKQDEQAATVRGLLAERERMMHTAALGASTQRISTGVSVATAVKGAVLIIGGALILASNPVGWMILAGAAVIGGVVALVKYLIKRKRKGEFVDKVLEINSDDSDHDAKRDKALQKRGFNSVDQFYNEYLAVSAAYLYQSGMAGDAEAKATIEATGISFEALQSLSEADGIALIAQHLHG